MKTLKFKNKEEWLLARKGRVTGTRLKDIVVMRGDGKKIGFYELIAERLATEPDGEDPMARGERLQPEALARFAKEYGKKVKDDLVMWVRDDEPSIAISPDGRIGTAEAVEVKCLSSARHLEAYLTNKVPGEYIMQVLQYFIVNPRIKKVYVVFYDPRVKVKDFFVIEVLRRERDIDIKKYLDYQRDVIAEVNEIVNRLTF